MRRHHIHDHCRRPAAGGPGIEPRWTPAAKEAVGTSHSSASHVWFTIRCSGHGWATDHEAGGTETAVGIWYHDIKPGNARGNDVRFTFRWQDTDQWDATDYRVDVRR